MGCGQHKRMFYTDYEYDEEVELRKFEEEVGAFKKNLNQIMPRICIEKDVIPISSLEDLFFKEFSENFVHLIRQGYFYKEIEGKKYYDARKINLLLFLLTNDTLVDNGKVKYHDKVSFIFTFIKTREDQNLCENLEANEANFLSFINDLVDIACEGIVDSYIKLKEVKRDGYINQIRTVKDKTREKLIDTLFFNEDKQKSGGLSFEEVNKKFGDEKWIFTSGWVREFAWDFMIKGAQHELNEEDKAELKKAEEQKAIDEKKVKA